MRVYSPLTLSLLETGARVAEPMTPGRVTLDDPAFSVMTDLREVAAATTRPEAAQMRVGHIVATLKAVGRKHLMVSEEGGRRIRGLFSASQVARQLGMELQTFEVARTFADIEAALVR